MILFPKFKRIVEVVKGISSMLREHDRRELEEQLKPRLHASQSDRPKSLPPGPGEPGHIIDVLG